MLLDRQLRDRGKAAYDLYRVHVAVDVVIAGKVKHPGVRLIPWERLSMDAQESWIRYAHEKAVRYGEK